MGYRAVLEATAETVQDLELAAPRRLEEAMALYVAGKYHSAIYLAGLAAEMYLKTACFFVDHVSPAQPVAPILQPVIARKRKLPFAARPESGHGLWFWHCELIHRRQSHRLRRLPNRFRRVIVSIHLDWFIQMRYRPGAATDMDAAAFISHVEWIANNHEKLRS